jgi:hypothetical protein
MPFLSRRSSRAGKRDGRSAPGAVNGRDDREYDDDEYPQDDDNWSPDQYFSPEGIKGRRASGRHGGPPPGRGYDGFEAGPPRNGYDTGPRAQGRRGPEAPAGYGHDRNQQPAHDGYDPAGEDGPGGQSPRGRRRDRGERGERRRPRLGRRDKGEDIWPDDGVSDEDYWASVAADRPLPGARPGPEADATQMMGTQAGTAPGRPPAPGHPGNESRPGGPGNESRTGRLGPPPGLSGPYPPGHSAPGHAGPPVHSGPPSRNSGPMARPGAGAGRPGFQPPDTRFDATERFDRVDRPMDPAAYTDPRMNGRGQDRRPPENRGGGRHSAGWSGSDDDPLTSKAFSREAMAATDARSYRAAAARRPPVPPDRYESALSEQTQTFTMNGPYSDPQAPTARYPVRGQPSQQPPPQQRPQAPPRGRPPNGQRPAADRRPSYPYPEQPGQPRPAPGRHAGRDYGRDDTRRGDGRY